MRSTLTLTTLLAAFALAISAWLWPSLPDPMPTHFGADGVADGWGPRWVGALLVPGLMFVLPPGIVGLTTLDPRTEHVARIQRPLAHVLVGLQAFLLLIHGMTLRASFSAAPAIDEGLLMGGVGVLFTVMGNALGKTRSNWFFGVRTPWTLQSEAVWARTHRFAGWAYALCGVVTILLAATTSGPVRVLLPLALLLIASVAAVVYSWIAWREEQGRAAEA